ncbi:MAG TPA: hypothetical protein VGK30_01925 [Candidatus Binatia bacterium]|jgi:hypothetical protein
MTRLAVGVLLVALMAPVVSAADFCISLDSGEQIVLKNFSLKKGKTFAVGGYSNLTQMGGVIHFPASGQAIASSDGSQLVLGISKYFGELSHTLGSSENLIASLAAASQTISLAFVAVPGKNVGPGATGLWASVVVSQGGTTFPGGNASIVACGKNDLGLTLP